jgi:DNA-binding transcriptional LysR family regulator
MNITLDRLKYFLEVAKLEHVGLASKSLGISASAISSAITTIEEEYGCTLFERSHQRIQLNDKGQWLREELVPIIEQLESLSQKINGKDSVFRGHLNVGGSFFLSNHYLQPVLHQLQKQNSEISIENSPLRTTQVIQEVLDGVLNYGLCISPSGHPNLEKQLLYKGTLKIVVAKNHPLVKKIQNKTFKLNFLDNYPAAIHKFSPGINYQETHLFDKIGVRPNIKNYYHSEELAIKSVLESDLWAVVPDLVFNHYNSKLVSIPLPRDWNAPFEICSIYRKSMKGREIFQQLDQQLLERLGQM